MLPTYKALEVTIWPQASSHHQSGMNYIQVVVSLVYKVVLELSRRAGAFSGCYYFIGSQSSLSLPLARGAGRSGRS